MRETETLIIGGGLSGLALAQGLRDHGHDFVLLEARDRFGGRIVSQQHGGADFDLGPAWIWPGQPRIAALAERMGLACFAQYSQGAQVFEEAQGRVVQGHGPHAMADALRIIGGLSALTDGLARALPEACRQTGSAVTALSLTDAGVTATLVAKAPIGAQIRARRAVLALPPRLAAQMDFDPPLPPAAQAALAAVPTWMAGQAKALAVYDTPFWRAAGLSGSAQSRRGPMVEIHDASPGAGGPYALFGFIGVAPQHRQDKGALRAQILAQLARLFGPRAADPAELFLRDWAAEPYTATAADSLPLRAHPAYGMPRSLAGLWDNRLFFAGTEVAPQWGGYVEGALEAAEAVLAAISDS